jgi:hypothetical protein
MSAVWYRISISIYRCFNVVRTQSGTECVMLWSEYQQFTAQMSLTAHDSEAGETFLCQYGSTSTEPQYRKYECNPNPPTPRLPCISPQSNANCRTTIQFVVKKEFRCGVIHIHYSGEEHLRLGTASIHDTGCSRLNSNVDLHPHSSQVHIP